MFLLAFYPATVLIAYLAYHWLASVYSVPWEDRKHKNIVVAAAIWPLFIVMLVCAATLQTWIART